MTLHTIYPLHLTMVRTYKLITLHSKETSPKNNLSFDTFIEDQNSHLPGLSGPHPLDSYRLETYSRLRANQA